MLSVAAPRMVPTTARGMFLAGSLASSAKQHTSSYPMYP
ncbi:hypothetical protein PR001_g19389 [Phytophthora rubi]|uniref:Uncharacterized protein n=1 Tax=Phytophthora rubi TaxID=129364 RepID=A0A6A3K2I3_9STRA|nr:hypothetical protein PR001_g19389 [Phytophthora rubi]